MQENTIYQIDAFAEAPFSGNPAAVIILDAWLDEKTMQNIAMENNLSETAFVVKTGEVNHFHIRFFTPLCEVTLCGHATLASSYVLFDILKINTESIRFTTLERGDLTVEKKHAIYTMDFPSDAIQEVSIDEELSGAFGKKPLKLFKGISDYMLIYADQKTIEDIQPDFARLKKLEYRGYIITAPGAAQDTDFVSRFFAPHEGIDEDPVTGSAHTTLIPYWQKQLGKVSMLARQLSKRQGKIYCEYLGDRVKIGGKAIHYMTGKIYIP